MAVYTEVNEAELASFLADYDLGHVLALKGIAEGVENSNFVLHVDAGYFILTLYEKRVDKKDLPFFLGLMEHLAGHGLNCPQPVRNRHGNALGRIAGRPAVIVTFLEGMWYSRPSVRRCAAVGEALGKLHRSGANFAVCRPNALGIDAWPALFEEARARADEVRPGIAEEIAKELTVLAGRWPRHLPRGVIHADLFPDNVCCSLAMNCPGLSISTSPARMSSPMMSRSRSMLGVSNRMAPSISPRDWLFLAPTKACAR
jgi:homoserine kinase type II